MRNRAVHHNVAAFSDLSLLYADKECYAEASAMSNSANLRASCYQQQ